MNTTRATLAIASAIATLLYCVLPAQAQTARSGGEATPNAQVMQQMQQLASERTQLQAENAKLKQELGDLKKQLQGLSVEKEVLGRRAQTSTAALARASEGKDSLEQNLQQQRVRMEELVEKFRETASTLREVESDRATIAGKLATREQEINTCVQKNLELFKVNGEILNRLEKPQLWSSLAKHEPFTQIKRVQIENLVDEYRGRAEDQRLPAPEKSSSVP